MIGVSATRVDKCYTLVA